MHPTIRKTRTPPNTTGRQNQVEASTGAEDGAAVGDAAGGIEDGADGVEDGVTPSGWSASAK
jgi:hypothetical protein